ncbi:uncharacterized protein LOC141596162 [Silene latifolia]|uniref:uncharacterized protein LOC141596162 n=1 Tax=Silene latifolia TaxID=37657 RepID=UPI003D7730F2
MVNREVGDIEMIMEDSELGKLAKTVYNQEAAFMDGFNSELAYANYLKECNDANDKVVSLLKRCNDFNARSKKWSEITEAEQCHVEVEGPQAVNSKVAHDCLRQAIDKTMERLKIWLPKNWSGLVKELEDEIEVAYAKFINLRKKFCGNHESELIKTSQGNQGGELIKADIAKDILVHVKYGINIGLQCVGKCRSRTKWVSMIAKDFEMLARELEGLDVRNENDMKRLVGNVSLFKQRILE